MTLGVARAATSDELTLYRSPGKASVWHCAIYNPPVVYTARINQTFASVDGVLSLTYDGGSGVLSDVKPDTIMYIGSSAGGGDIGMVRVKAIDSSNIQIDQTSEIAFADNQYLTIVQDWRLLARHVNIIGSTPYVDGNISYSNQHAVPDPTPIMGSHRVIKMVSGDASATFDWSHSYVIDGTSITGYATVAPGSSSSSNMTTDHPTIHWDTYGFHPVYLTVTGANGKSFLGVRFVFVWDKNHLPPKCQFATVNSDVGNGGPDFQVTFFKNADTSTVREGALAILFSIDQFNLQSDSPTQQDIGAVDGSANIEAIGWIGPSEEINWNPERGSVKFSAYGGQYWMQKVPTYPLGVEFTTTTPAAWTEFKNLTVDKGLWHLLHWACTATRLFDCFLTDNTLYIPETSSPANDLWSQINEIATLSIYARAGFNAQGQLFIRVHPQLTPSGSRTWATVMNIEKRDWLNEITFTRTALRVLASLNMSGVAVDSAGKSTPYFALAPGHTYGHYGKPEAQDRLLVSGQADVITKAGLYWNFRNNPFSEIPIPLKADVRLIDCYPNQRCTITILPFDTPRGIGYSGGLIPKGFTVNHDGLTGRTNREVIFEAETFEGLAVKGDVPGSDDFTLPPIPPLPKLPPIPVIVPGGNPTGSDGGPPNVMLILKDYGVAYTEKFNTDSPSWALINPGLAGFETDVRLLFKTPNRAIYAQSDSFIARADYPGAEWVILEQASMYADFHSLQTAGFNPLKPEEVNYILYRTTAGHILKYGGGSVWTSLAGFLPFDNYIYNGISFGYNTWATMASLAGTKIYSWDSSYGALVTKPLSLPPGDFRAAHIRAGTTPLILTGVANSASAIVGTSDFGTTDDTRGSIDVGGALPPAVFAHKVACDPTGNQIMAAGGVGTNVTPSKSGDGAFVFTLIPDLPLSHWRFTYAGGSGADSRWIAGADGGYLYYNDKFGVGPWSNKLGNLPDLAPSGINIMGIVVVDM